MMHQIASKVPQISKSFPKGRETHPPLRPLPQDGNQKQGSAPQSQQLPMPMMQTNGHQQSIEMQ